MKILFLTPANLDETHAPARRAKKFSRSWAEAGHEMVLIGCGDSFSVESDPHTTVRIPDPDLRFVGTVLFHLVVPFLMLYELIRFAPDGVLVRDMPFFVYPAFMLSNTEVPLLIRVNSLNLEEARLHGRSSLWLWGAKWSFRILYGGANQCIALTEAIKTYLHESYHVPNKRITVRGNAIDTELFSPVEPQKARDQLNLNSDDTLCFYVGSFHPQHGMMHFVDVFEFLRKRCPDVRCILAGEGGQKDRVRQSVHQRGLDQDIIFTGRITDEELVQYISASDVGLYPMNPDYREVTERTFPQKVYEYLACGTPVISFANSPALVRLLEENGGGVIVQNIEQPEQASQEIQSYLSRNTFPSPKKLSALVQEYSYDQRVRQYEALLERLNHER